jgi:hypothetical protein
MKKIYFFGAVAVAALALTTGCSKNELVNETPSDAKAISFRVNGDAPQARPNGPQRTTGTTLGYVNAFAVYGEDYEGNTAANAALFNGVSVVRQVGSGDIFDYNPKRLYTQNADTAHFYAYSPISKFVTGGTMAGLSTFSFDYENQLPDATGNATQEDLLYAFKGVKTSVNAVALNFRHALSRIFVTATNTSPVDVYVDALTLKNLYNAGTFTFPLAPTDTIGWTPSGNRVDLPYILADSRVVVKEGTTSASLVTSKEQGMMIIPQVTANTTSTQTTLATNDFALEVRYDMGNLKNQVAYILLKNDFGFQPNHQYQINIAFTGTAITFTVTVTDFTDDLVQYP